MEFCDFSDTWQCFQLSPQLRSCKLPSAGHRLTSELLQFPQCLFLPSCPSATCSHWEPGVTPGMDTERALVPAGAQHGLGGSWCGSVGSWHRPLDAALIRCLATVFLLSFFPRLSHAFLALRKGTEAATSRNCGLHATEIPTPTPTDVHPLPVPMVGILARGKNPSLQWES